MSSVMETSFKDNEIIPDVIDSIPLSEAKITYDGGHEVHLGKELTPTQVKNIPIVKWECDPNVYYTLIMTDPDAPSRAEPLVREVNHWLVGNILGCNINNGDTIHEYVGSGPPEGTGLHRYIFLVFKQNGKITFDEERVSNRSRQNRLNFSTRKFIEKYSLNTLTAANFYQAQYDDYVPILRQQLAGEPPKL